MYLVRVDSSYGIHRTVAQTVTVQRDVLFSRRRSVHTLALTCIWVGIGTGTFYDSLLPDPARTCHEENDHIVQHLMFVIRLYEGSHIKPHGRKRTEAWEFPAIRCAQLHRFDKREDFASRNQTLFLGDTSAMKYVPTKLPSESTV